MEEDDANWGSENMNGNNGGMAPSFGRGYMKKKHYDRSNLGQKTGGDNQFESNAKQNYEEDGEWNDDSASGGNNWQSNNDGGGNGWQPKGSSNWNKNDDVPHGGGYRENRSGGNNTCFKCNESGHMARECPNSARSGGGGGGGGGRACFKCGEDGHISRDCPNPGSNGGGGGGGRACFKCGEEGHMSRECPNPGSNDNRSSGSRVCHKCNEEGHISRDCPNAGASRGGVCYNCNEEGHMSKDCPKPQRSRRGCRNCGEDGHIAANCPEPKKEGGDSSHGTCNRCKKEGHMSKDCTEEVIDESGRKLVAPYVPPDNTSNESDLFASHLESGINFDKYDKIKITVNNSEKFSTMDSFETDELRELVRKNIVKCGYAKPTPIQKTCIPLLLGGKDMMACAQTGSGKTAAFMIPIVNDLMASGCDAVSYSETTEPFALVIAPTRELVIQIHQDATKFSWGSIVKCAKIYGGTTVGHSLRELQDKGCHILVATVGRLDDFVKRGKISFGRLKYLVLDEADRMLDMGFEGAIKELLNHSSMPSIEERHTLMFSATFPPPIQGLAKKFLKDDYSFVVVGNVGSANTDVSQSFEQVEKKDKKNRLVALLTEYTNENKKVLVFVETKRQTDFLATYLSQNQIKSTSIHGDRLQREREMALNSFKSGEMKVLIATAVAARGLDIKGVDYVINYDLPKEIDEYVHRIGRTGRVGNMGNAVSFFDSGVDEQLRGPLLRILAQATQNVPDWLQEGNYGTGGGYDGLNSTRDVRSHETGYDNVPTANDDDDGW